MILQLTFRNIFRNRFRTTLTLSAIVIGCVALIVVQGFLSDISRRQRDATIQDVLGHLQIYAKGFNDQGNRDPYQYMIAEAPRVVSLIQADPAVVAVAPKIRFSGLLSNGDQTLGVSIEAVEPGAKQPAQAVRAWVAGGPLDAGDDKSGVAGVGLAQALGLQAGTSAILVANTIEGSINAMDLRIKGVFATTSKNFDDHVVRVSIPAAQQLLQTQQIQSLTVVLRRVEDTHETAARLERLFQQQGLSLEVKRWDEMPEAYMVEKTSAFFERLMIVLKIIVACIAVLGVSNTMSMSVLERVGEIGTMRALGTPRRRIALLFLVEGAFLGLFGGLAGVLSGALLARLVTRIGIPMPGEQAAAGGFTAGVEIVPGILLFSMAMAVGASVLSSLLPAIKATRLETAEALRQNV